MKVWTMALASLVIAGFTTFACLAAGEKTTVDSNADFPYEVKTLQRGETQGDGKGYSNTLIVRVNKKTGETWILTHVGNDLIWVLVPDAPKKTEQKQ